MTRKQRVSEAYADSNLEFATKFAADPERYPGIQQIWADMVLSRAAEADQSDCGPLFEGGKVA